MRESKERRGSGLRVFRGLFVASCPVCSINLWKLLGMPANLLDARELGAGR